MSVTVSVPDILSQMSFRMNMPAIAAGQFLTPADTLTLLNMSLRELSTLLARLYGDQHFTQTATLATQAGLNLVSLPANCTDVNSVTWLVDATRKVQLGHATLHDLNSTTLSQWYPNAASFPFNGVGGAPKYQMQGAALILWPVPQAVYSLAVNYTTGVPVSIATVSDTFLLPVPVCDSWLVARMCEVLTGTREDLASRAQLHQQLRLEAEQNLTEAASNRDRNAGCVMQDVRSWNGTYSSRRWTWPY